ncbi:nascent polypeptide-associated alpha subunit [Malassezia pachydermatis]|uniref:Nascent polypeptide-associated complex subunit alpha n=1 Tax=Malassezia pachydermatis TaxID=77020 RepID=A0A0M9VQ88_9BASI|nr:nascent polypeptide-associated alpha subunit [Malassezia pachydermatis]KOS15105.1 nascent polypeptide-associated alpha subunit [Malassezia pachydermatis]
MSIQEISEDVKDLKVDNTEVEAENGEVSVPDRVQSRAERKSRKALQNIGLKKVSGIQRVTLRRPRGLLQIVLTFEQHLYVVSNPDVYKSPVSDVYMIFGEVKSEDMSAFAQAQAAQLAAAQEKMMAEGMGSTEPNFNVSDLTANKKIEEEEEDDDSPIDETGVDAKDIDLVMEQVSCSRRKAVKALKENNGDLINAIMSIS